MFVGSKEEYISIIFNAFTEEHPIYSDVLNVMMRRRDLTVAQLCEKHHIERKRDYYIISSEALQALKIHLLRYGISSSSDLI